MGLKSGVDILKLVHGEAQHGDAFRRNVMTDLAKDLRQGHSLTAAMQNQGDFFPPLLIAMSQAGEVSGKLEQTLLRAADHFELRVKLRRDFFQQITWPIMQLCIGILIVSLLIYLLGVLTPATGGEMFDPLGFGLRGGSGVFIFLSLVACVISVVGGLIWALLNNYGGVHALIPVLYRVPIFGEALQTITLSRFTSNLAMSLEAGIDPIRAIQIGLDATGSEFYRSAKDGVENAIRGGKTMSETLSATGLFPEEFITSVEVAELAGTDAEALHHLAADYDDRSRRAMTTLAMLAGRLIGGFVVLIMIFIILRIATQIMGGLQDALQPI
jgi:type II secretory pathway component PulF